MMKAVQSLNDGGLCLVCSRGHLKRHVEPTPYTYKGDTMVVNVEGMGCDVCDETYLTHARLRRLEPLSSDQRRRMDGILTAEEIRLIRTRLGVSQDVLSQVLGSGPKTFARYENGTVSNRSFQVWSRQALLFQAQPAPEGDAGMPRPGCEE